jgi:hypothetical protein
MAVPQTVLDLMRRFDANAAQYRSPGYNETEARRELIDPLFKALGWDVDNTQGYSEKYKEVVHEARVRVGRATKAPDYAFRIGGRAVFFVEAKRPALTLRDDADAAYQVRRYAWSAKLPLSILTNFAEFAVYDCRFKPTQHDQAGAARVLYVAYDEYPARWGELCDLFSPEAIRTGALDRYVDSAKAKRGTMAVDDAFLAEIEQWREALARNFALRNALTVRQLNFAVQKTIDRIIFLRIAEDRGFEPYHRLGDVAEGRDVYPQLGELFRQADNRYNAGLFHFPTETGRGNVAHEDVDDFTLGLGLDDRVIKPIIANLYYPESPYAFDALPADILGQVYERFLGSVVRLTPSGRAKVEEKPEVRKAGGVYYTPTYIVDDIIEHTVGALLRDRTYRQVRGSVRAAPFRLVDPACGSGTFLLQAYQYLLDWYLAQYLDDDAVRHARAGRIIEGAGGWRLTTEERKAILLTHIYGVDIDPQAVEVTKLSLLLKVLEGEDEESLGTQLAMSIAGRARVLPDLGRNIRCGNSLIGSDFYAGEQLSLGLVDEETMYRINAFDWDAPQGFGKAMAAGGFDAVIGNPPYIRIQALKRWAPQEVEFYKQAYTAASKGNYDIYVVFVEKGLDLLRQGGRLGYILPHKFFNARYGEPLRDLIAQGQHLADIVHFGDQQVFENATTYTCLLFLEKDGRERFHVAKVDDLAAWRADGAATEGDLQADEVDAGEWNFVVGPFAPVFKKLQRMSIRLGDIADEIFQGLITGADAVFILEYAEKGSYLSKATKQTHKIERELMHPLCKGSVNIRRYHISEVTKAVLFPYEIIEGQAVLISAQDLATDYPNAWEYLRQNRAKLESREHGKWKHDRWYALGRSQNLNKMEQVKLLTPSIANFSSFMLDSTEFYYFVGSGGGGGGGYGIILSPNIQLSYEYVLGLLNSKLLDAYLKSFSTPFRGGYYAYNRQYIEQLPIRTIDFDDPDDVARHDKMVGLVERMLDLHTKLAEAKTPQAKRLFKQQITVTDRAIDALVYALYALTEDEIAMVEGRET